MATTGNYQVHIGGDVSGQIAIGNNNLQIQNVGGVVNIVKPSTRSPFRKRAGRVWQKPRAFPVLLDRVQELLTVESSMQSGISVSVFGPGGIGKTTFLSHLTNTPATSNYPDGLVYLYVSGRGFDDLLQIVFDAFFSSAGNVMPTTGQLHHHLHNIRAIILLDDVTLAREAMQALVAAMPSSCFIFTSVERSLWGEGEAILLGGLPEEDQVELFAREIGRPLSEEEKTDALIVCYYLQGHPLRIVQAASLVTAAGRTIAEIKKQFRNDSTPLAAEQELLSNLGVSQKRVLAVLGAAAGALIPWTVIGTLLRLTDVQRILQSLVDMGLAWNQGSRYGLGSSLVGQVGRLWDLSSWEDSLINYFATWIAQQPREALIEDAADALQRVIELAGEKSRWSDVIRIGRALEQILILGRRWQAWLDILNLILKAAKADRDQSTEAWVLHQLGSRAMCLNYADQAREFLTQALNIRRAIGDKAGLVVTQHNLNVLRGVPVFQKPGVTQQPKLAQADSGIGRYVAYGFGGITGLGVLILIALWILSNFPLTTVPPTQSPIPPVIPSSTLPFTSTPSIFTPTITATETSTSTFTPTFTPTFTETYTVTSFFTPSIMPSRIPTSTWTLTIIPTTVTVYVAPPDTTAPPAPANLSPNSNNTVYDCPSGPAVILAWSKPSDPSDITRYNFQLLYSPDNKSFTNINLGIFSVSINPSADVTSFVNQFCGNNQYFRWRVRAQDGAGNWSVWSSPYARFRAQHGPG